MFTKRKSLITVVLLGFTSVFAAGLMAKGPDFVTVTLPDPVYRPNVPVSCLDGYVDIEWSNITITSREFITKNQKTYHYIESWSWDAMWTATDGSDDTWIGRGSSPGAINAVLEKGHVVQLTSQEKVFPVGDNDGPSLLYTLRAKVTMNANGELTAYWWPAADYSDWVIRCVGPKNK